MTSAPVVPNDRQFFGHPRGLSTLFLTELWERFSYYGMRALLIYYMVKPLKEGALGLSLAQAGAIYGLYTGFVYLLALPGGWVADRITGQRRAVMYGGILIAIGHYLLAVPLTSTFFIGLIFIVVGTGLLKPNISTLVGQLYTQNDPRRDAGYSIFYMGVNLGAFIAPLACSSLGEKINWHYGFGLAGVGMTAGVIQFALGQRQLGNAGLPPQIAPGERRRYSLYGFSVLAVFLAVMGMMAKGIISLEAVSSGFGILLTVLVILLFAGMLLFGHWSAVEKKRLIAIFILFAASATFWSIYEQAGSTLSLFADRNTDRSFPGMEKGFPAGWFQSLPALFVIAITPGLAWLWVKLGSRNPSSFAKFAIGLVFAGLSLLILIPVAGRTGVSPIWLTLTYLLQTIGELLISPVGLSAMSKLAPARIVSLMMGLWFVSISVGDYISGRLASIYDVFPLPQLFGLVGMTAIVAAAILFVFLKPLRRLLGGVN